MRLSVIMADPAGNRTALVKDPVGRESRAAVARRLLELDSLDAEQIGFLTRPIAGGEVRLEMMGGEFCGNALRSAGLWHACKSGFVQGRRVMAEISGCDRPLAVECDPTAQTACAQLPLPYRIDEVIFAGQSVCAVHFRGILHLVRFAPIGLSAGELKAALAELCAAHSSAAAGLMEYDEAAGRVLPAVYVRDTDSLFYERSCASGSAAVAALLALRENKAVSLSLSEPGGVLEACADARNGVLRFISIGGVIRLEKERCVEL